MDWYGPVASSPAGPDIPILEPRPLWVSPRVLPHVVVITERKWWISGEFIWKNLSLIGGHEQTGLRDFTASPGELHINPNLDPRVPSISQDVTSLTSGYYIKSCLAVSIHVGLPGNTSPTLSLFHSKEYYFLRSSADTLRICFPVLRFLLFLARKFHLDSNSHHHVEDWFQRGQLWLFAKEPDPDSSRLT